LRQRSEDAGASWWKRFKTVKVIAGEPNIYSEEAPVNGIVLVDEMDFGKDL